MTIMRHIRRFLVFVCVVSLLMGGFSVMAVASDINGDGVLNTADARVLLLSLVGDGELTEAQREAADLDGDGEFTTADVRLLIAQTLQDPIVTTTSATAPVTTRPTQLSTTMETTTTTRAWSTTYTVPPTTTTTWYDCDTTFTTTTTTMPTTMPYGGYTVTVESVYARAGDTFTLPVSISSYHAVVGLDLELMYDPSVMTLVAVNDEARNRYATELHSGVFSGDAQWRFSKLYDGLLQMRYVSSDQDGSLRGGELFTLTFRLHEDAMYDSIVNLFVRSHLSCANGVEYEPSVKAVGGVVEVTPRTTTTTSTTGTTDTTYPPTTTTYPLTTTTTWVLTGPEGTAPTTTMTTTDFVYTQTVPMTQTTLPYGDPLCLTGGTTMVRIGETFTWSVSVSKNHSLVGLELEIRYDPTVLTLLDEDLQPGAALPLEEAQWRFSKPEEGVLRLRYISAASTGDAKGGELLTLPFYLRTDTDADDTMIEISVLSYVSSVNGFDYTQSALYITNGGVQVASRTTRPKTTTEGTTDTTTFPWTTTYPPTDPWTTTTYPSTHAWTTTTLTQTTEP